MGEGKGDKRSEGGRRQGGHKSSLTHTHTHTQTRTHTVLQPVCWVLIKDQIAGMRHIKLPTNELASATFRVPVCAFSSALTLIG